YDLGLRSHFKIFLVNLLIVLYFFLVIAPVFYQAALYVAFGQALRRLDHYGATLLRFEPKILISGMIVADVVTTIIQVVGAALIGVAESARFGNRSSSLTSEQANDILLAGLSIQVFTYLAFSILLVLCIIRSERTFTAAHLPKRFSLLMLLSAFLLLLRTTFRLAETAQGVFGYASSHEALFGCLEYLPVILAISLWAAMPLEETLPIDVDDLPGSPSHESTRTLSMRQSKSVQLGRTSSRGSTSPRGSSRDRRREEEDDERDLEAGSSPSGSMAKTEGTRSSATAMEQDRPTPERRGSTASSILRTGMIESDPLVLERTASGRSRLSARKLRN
ncbi:hypothetical protein JCM8547_005961, partial [Rhodosporidiobolus lusitaniae]